MPPPQAARLPLLWGCRPPDGAGSFSAILGCVPGGAAGSRGPRDGLLTLLSSGQCRPNGMGQVLQANQVAVLVASGGPGHVVAKAGVGWRWESLAKVDHPDAGMAFLVVEEEQRAPNHLGGREQGG